MFLGAPESLTFVAVWLVGTGPAMTLGALSFSFVLFFFCPLRVYPGDPCFGRGAGCVLCWASHWHGALVAGGKVNLSGIWVV